MTPQEEAEQEMLRRYADKEQKVNTDYEKIFYNKDPIPCKTIIVSKKSEYYAHKKPLLLMTTEEGKEETYLSLSHAMRELKMTRGDIRGSILHGTQCMCQFLNKLVSFQYQKTKP